MALQIICILVKIEVLMVASMKMAIFLAVAACSLVDIDWRFRGAYCLHQQGDEWLLWNISQYLPDYMLQHPRRQPSSICRPFLFIPHMLYNQSILHLVILTRYQYHSRVAGFPSLCLEGSGFEFQYRDQLSWLTLTPLTLKPVIGHNPDPIPTILIFTTHIIRIYLNIILPPPPN
jgi:hypothetical protein